MPCELARRCVETPIGPMTLAVDGEALVEARFGRSPFADGGGVLDQAERELQEYFSGRRRAFDVPLRPRGTPFQQRVWQALRGIPYGQTRAYQDVARAVDAPRACRAVGGANHKNPLPVFIPCHRVIGRGGALVGYAGGLEAKKRLLELEGAL